MKARKVLTRRRQFALVLNRGSSRVGHLVVMKILANELESSRFGLVTSKRVGNAVVRNRVRRRLREILKQLRLKSGWDIVFIARQAAAGAKYADINEEVTELLAEARLLADSHEEICINPN